MNKSNLKTKGIKHKLGVPFFFFLKNKKASELKHYPLVSDILCSFYFLRQITFTISESKKKILAKEDKELKFQSTKEIDFIAENVLLQTK